MGKIKSDNATLLNDLDSMQRTTLYALRRGVLRQAELLIVKQEEEIKKLREVGNGLLELLAEYESYGPGYREVAMKRAAHQLKEFR